MEETYYLKLLLPPKKEREQEIPHLDPMARLRGIILNLVGNALTCLNRISQLEMEKDSPSSTLMEEYFLLHHYLDFIKRLCQKISD